MRKLISILVLTTLLISGINVGIGYAQSSADSTDYTTIPTKSLDDTYIQDISNADYLSSKSLNDYDRYKAMLYALSSPNANSLVDTNIANYLDSCNVPDTTQKFIKTDDPQSVLINRILDYVTLHNTTDTYDTVLLYSIVAGRGSAYGINTSNPIAIPQAYTPIYFPTNSKNNQDSSASALYSQLQQNLSSLSSADQDTKRMSTISQRIMLYYYKAQSSKTINTTDADTLSISTPNNMTVVRTFEPLVILTDGSVGGLIHDARAYVLFMNAVNEITFARPYLFNNLNGITKDSNITDSITKDVAYFQALKNAITFLSGLPTMDQAKPVIDYWYAKDTSVNMSLEDLYEKVVTLGIDTSSINPFKPADGPAGYSPLKNFFSTNPADINDNLKLGIRASATYIPLQTNVYDPYTYKVINSDAFFKFHDQWGYYRKALYMDTDAKSAVNTYTTNKVGKLKVVTLKDMLNADGDLTLYTDTSFYNENKLKTLQEKAQDVVNSVKNTTTDAQTVTGNVWDTAKMIGSGDVSGLISKVMTTEANKLVEYFHSLTSTDSPKGPNGETVLSKTDIDYWLNQPNYDPLQSFAFISSIYRDSDVYNFIHKEGIKPVFVSSKDLCNISYATDRDKSSLFNYILLRNISASQLINYTTNIDMNSPLYMDVYGNILTQSGYVVIPAAANATLQSSYSPVTAAFLTTYGKNYKVPVVLNGLEYDGAGKMLQAQNKIFQDSKTNKYWEFSPTTLNSTIDINRLSTGSPNTMSTLYTLYGYHLQDKGFDLGLYISDVFLEVVCGAPLEYIDQKGEKLTTVDPSEYTGIIQATKLDNLLKAFNIPGQNSVLSLPNLAFMNGVEYIIFFVYKLCMIVVIVLLLIQIFVAGMRMEFGLRTVGKMIMTVLLTLAVIFTIPTVFNISYYQANKWLLQNETESISMLNLEKSSSGVEIGVNSVGVPSINTKLYLKVKDINIPWYDLFYKIIYSSISNNMDKLYKSYESNDMAYGAQGFEEKNGSIYMNVQTLFDSSDVNFDSDFSSLYHVTHGSLPASFYSPYYTILTSLVSDVNTFNSGGTTGKTHVNYAPGFFKGGQLKSIGLIKDYLSSDEFIKNDTQDMLHLRQIYGLEIDSMDGSPFSQEDITKLQQSQWCNTKIPEKEIQTRIEKMNQEARSFVARNKDLLGKISDETFLKSMSLDLAIYHNKLFGVNSFDSIDVYSLSNDDLTRLSIAPTLDVMHNSPMSFSKFVLAEGGVVAVYLEAVLAMVQFVAGWVKPIITLALFGVLFVSIFVYRLVLRKDNHNTLGYIKVVSLLCASNIVYALILKGSLYLPVLHLPTAVCLVVDIIFQVSFLGWYSWIAVIAVRNWRDLASDRIDATVLNIKEMVSGSALRARLENSEEEAKRNPSSGWRVYERLKKSDEVRDYVAVSREEDI